MAKSAPIETKELDWQLNFNTALKNADKSLIGDVGQIVDRSFKNFRLQKRKGAEIIKTALELLNIEYEIANESIDR